MPAMGLDPAKIDALFQNGHISQDVYNGLMGTPAPVAEQQVAAMQYPQVYASEPIAPVNEGLMLAANTPQQTVALDGFVRDEAEMARRAEQQRLLARNQAPGIADDTLPPPPIDDGLAKKRAFAQKAGISDDIINQRLGTPLLAQGPSSDLQKPMPGLKLASDTAPVPKASGSGTRSPYDAGYNMQIQGVRDAATAVGQKTDAQNQDLQNYLKQEQNAEQDRQTNEIFRQGQMDLAIKDLDAATTAVANMRVDPKQFWAKADTADKIIMGVSLFLGAFGAANDGVNRVVPIITGAIDRDIAAQKVNIANAQEGVNKKSNALTQLRSVFKDERMAEEAAKVAALERVKMQVAQKAMQYARPEVAANAKKLVGELMNKQVEHREKFINAAKNGGLDRPLTPSERLAQQKDIGERTVAGLGMLTDAREAPKMRDMKANVDTLRRDINNLVSIAEKGRSFNPLSTDKADAQSLATRIFLKLKEMENLGVPQSFDIEMIRKLIPDDVTAVFTTNALHKIEKARELIEDGWLDTVRARGLSDPTVEEARRARKRLKEGK